MAERRLLVLSVDEWDRLTEIGERSVNAIFGKMGAPRASEPIDGDEITKAFIRGFEFSESKGETPNQVRANVYPQEIYSAIAQANGRGIVTLAEWSKESQSVHNHYERVARFLNEALAGR